MVVPSAPISPEILEALQVLYTRLQGTPITWAITGSLGMALQGMPLVVQDIDLQSDRDGAYAIQMLFPECVEIAVSFRQTELINSHFGRLELDGVTVEIMGDVAKRLPDSRWSAPPRLPAIIRYLTYANMRLPVIDLRYEYQAYLQMGRLSRAEEIKHWLERGQIDGEGI